MPTSRSAQDRRPAVRSWVWPFELLSLLLLVALIAALAVAVPRENGAGPDEKTPATADAGTPA